MWIFLKNSFLSIVDKGDPTGQTLLVRARRKGDIERVFPDAQVIEGGGTDYAFRASIDREQVAQTMADQVRAIRTPNFKNTVTEPGRHDAYMDVWAAMLHYQGQPRN
ncbi:hypothetical protein D3C76_1116260 [compost metagenome]